MNPRIQVEHTVTEEVTDVDLVQSQMRIAAGQTLAELGLLQDQIQLRGAALQCRITTEDPTQGFRPDTGKITTYRSPGGAGIRLDGGTTAAGSQISPHFDSMLAKLTCRGRDFGAAVVRARRALAEFRIRGVSTNIPFLQAVLDDPDFVAGDVSTSFIDERPQLLRGRESKDRGSKMLNWLVDTTVNKPNGENPLTDRSAPEAAAHRPRPPRRPPGRASACSNSAPPASPARCASRPPLAVTETTFRDAHQSLLATRVRTKDLVTVAPYVARLTPQLLSVEAWGGATYDVALRFLGEDPWERLDRLRTALPNIAIQMLLRGRNTVGYTPYPTEVTDAFVREAATSGIEHLAEQAFPANETLVVSEEDVAARSISAQPSRVAFRVPATSGAIPLQLNALLALLEACELRVVDARAPPVRRPLPARVPDARSYRLGS